MSSFDSYIPVFGERSKPMRNIFLSYASADTERVIKLYKWLLEKGFRPWMAAQNLRPGEEWGSQINKILRTSSTVLVCLSKSSISKAGHLQREIRYALDLSEQRSTGGAFMIPVRLEECEVPSMLARYHWVNLYEPEGHAALLRALDSSDERQRFRTFDIRARYYLDNLTALLLQELTIEELRKLLYDLPTGSRYLYRETSELSNKFEIINVLLTEIRPEDIDWILEQFKRRHNAAYHRHAPYRRDEQAYEIKQGGIRGSLASPTEMLENPYIVGNPVHPENTRVFLGRYDIAKAILSEIQKGNQRPSILLYGRRRMGKTSALLNMGRLIEDMRLVHVYISGQSAKFHNDTNFCFYLTESILSKLEEESIDVTFLHQAGFSMKETFLIDPIIRLANFLSACRPLLESRGIHCLLAIDEYEEIDRHIGENQGITRELLLQLRDTMQFQSCFVFLFAGTHFLRDLSKVDWTSIFINVKTLHISFLEREDSIALLTRPVPEMTYRDSNLIEQLLFLTGCQPFLLQAMASEIVTILNSMGSRIVTQEVVNRSTMAVLKKQNTYFDHIWDVECNSPSLKHLLKRVADNNFLKIKSLRGKDSELRDMVRREILKIESDKVYLTMPLIREWLRKNQHIL